MKRVNGLTSPTYQSPATHPPTLTHSAILRANRRAAARERDSPRRIESAAYVALRSPRTHPAHTLPPAPATAVPSAPSSARPHRRRPETKRREAPPIYDREVVVTPRVLPTPIGVDPRCTSSGLWSVPSLTDLGRTTPRADSRSDAAVDRVREWVTTLDTASAQQWLETGQVPESAPPAPADADPVALRVVRGGALAYMRARLESSLRKDTARESMESRLDRKAVAEANARRRNESRLQSHLRVRKRVHDVQPVVDAANKPKTHTTITPQLRARAVSVDPSKQFRELSKTVAIATPHRRIFAFDSTLSADDLAARQNDQSPYYS